MRIDSLIKKTDISGGTEDLVEGTSVTFFCWKS